MPFVADTRCGIMTVELNINWVIEMLEHLTDKILNPEIDIKDFIIEDYVRALEKEYETMMNFHDTKSTFCDWFVQNYDNVEEWNKMQDLLILEED